VTAGPGIGQPEALVVFVEIPGGSRNKYELDRETGAIVLDRMLFTSTRYPADYGFVESTLAGDGDPLDALVLVGEPTFPGCRIRARPVGVFRMRDEKGADDKILCVPFRDPLWSSAQELSDLPQTLLNEIEHFFAVYKDLEDRPVSTEGWGSREEAEAVIAQARRAWAGGRPAEGSVVSPSILPWPTVGRGDEHHPVPALQYLLRARTEHVLVVDGVFGPRTEAAVQEVQRVAGLTTDGVVGPGTWPVVTTQVGEGSRGDAVRGVQEEFRFRSLSDDPDAGLRVDGIFGARTDRAVRGFQSAVGIGVDGIVGPITWRALVSGMLSL